jgi:hypothetical protein
LGYGIRSLILLRHFVRLQSPVPRTRPRPGASAERRFFQVYTRDAPLAAPVRNGAPTWGLGGAHSSRVNQTQSTRASRPMKPGPLPDLKTSLTFVSPYSSDMPHVQGHSGP